MTETGSALSHTISLRSPSGQPVVRVGVLPAAVGTAVALAFVPRLTALVALAALLRRMSLSVDG
jgi:hypothetical protein